MRTMYFAAVFSFLFLPFSSPNLSGRRLDVYHTSTHDVALVQIKNACLKCAARGSLEIQCAKIMQKIAIWAPSHDFAKLYSSQLRHVSTIGKKLLSSSMSSRSPHNMVNFGPLIDEIRSGVWGTPANFNEFCVLAALLHGSQLVSVSETLQR